MLVGPSRLGADGVVGGAGVAVDTSGGVLPGNRGVATGLGLLVDEADLDTRHGRLDTGGTNDAAGDSAGSNAHVGALTGGGPGRVVLVEAELDGLDLGAVLGARGKNETVLLVHCLSAPMWLQSEHRGLTANTPVLNTVKTELGAVTEPALLLLERATASPAAGQPEFDKNSITDHENSPVDGVANVGVGVGVVKTEVGVDDTKTSRVLSGLGAALRGGSGSSGTHKGKSSDEGGSDHCEGVELVYGGSGGLNLVVVRRSWKLLLVSKVLLLGVLYTFDRRQKRPLHDPKRIEATPRTPEDKPIVKDVDERPVTSGTSQGRKRRAFRRCQGLTGGQGFIRLGTMRCSCCLVRAVSGVAGR